MPNLTTAHLLHTIEEEDLVLGAALASQRHQPAVKAVAEFGQVGDQGPLYALSAGVMLAGQGAGNRRLKCAGLAMFFAVVVADGLKRLAKLLVHRSRPHVVLEEKHYERGEGKGQRKPEQSFPSGHTAASVAAAGALGLHYPQTLPYTRTFIILIAAARLLKGAHWPLDVLAGVLLGKAAQQASQAVLSRADWRPACEC